MLGCERCLCNRIELDVHVYGLYLFEQDMFVYFSKFNCWHQFLFVNILAIKICPLGIWDHKEAFRSAVVTEEKNTSAKIIFAVNSSDINRLFVKRALAYFKRNALLNRTAYISKLWIYSLIPITCERLWFYYFADLGNITHMLWVILYASYNMTDIVWALSNKFWTSDTVISTVCLNYCVSILAFSEKLSKTRK